MEFCQENWDSFDDELIGPPKFFENEVLSFIKSYSERPFGKAPISSVPAKSNSHHRPSHPLQKPTQPTARPTNNPKSSVSSSPQATTPSNHKFETPIKQQPSFPYNTYGSTFKPLIIDNIPSTIPAPQTPPSVKVTHIPNSNSIQKNPGHLKPTLGPTNKVIPPTRPLHTTPSSQPVKPIAKAPVPVLPLSPKPHHHPPKQAAVAPLAKANPASHLNSSPSAFLKPPSNSKPIQQSATHHNNLPRNPTAPGSKQPVTANSPHILRGSNTPVYSTAARLAHYTVKPVPVSAPKPIFLGPAASTNYATTFPHVSPSGSGRAFGRPIHVVFAYNKG